MSKSRLWRVWTSTWDPNKRHWEVRARCSVGRGPSLAKTCRHTARDALFRVSCCKTDLVFSSFRCLSIYLPVARSEAERAGPEAYQIRQPPLKAAPPLPKCGGSTISVPKIPSAPGTNSPSLHRTVSPDPRVCPNLPKGQALDTKAPFFSTAAAATFLSARRKKSGGRIPRPGPVGRPPLSRARGAESSSPPAGGHPLASSAKTVYTMRIN